MSSIQLVSLLISEGMSSFLFPWLNSKIDFLILEQESSAHSQTKNATFPIGLENIQSDSELNRKKKLFRNISSKPDDSTTIFRLLFPWEMTLKCLWLGFPTALHTLAGNCPDFRERQQAGPNSLSTCSGRLVCLSGQPWGSYMLWHWTLQQPHH